MVLRDEKGKDDPGTGGNGVGESDFLFAEQFKALRAKVEYKIDMHNLRLIAVTSAVAGEGKTLSSLNLARGLAATGRKRVLLIDADLRKSDLSRQVRIPRLPGLSELLSGTVALEQVVRPTDTPGFFIVPGGSRVSAPSEMISGNRFRSFLAEARDRFDAVLMDTPPVIPVADTHSLVDQVDGFLLIYRIGFTPHPLLKKAVEEIGTGKIIGVVLNGVAPRKQKYYQTYYGKYYKQEIKTAPSAE